MRFLETEEHETIASAIDEIALSADVVAAARAWAAGDHEPGLALWRSLAEFGLLGLRVEEDQGGIGAEPAFMIAAFERLGFHGLPGPLIETVAVAPKLLPPEDLASVSAGDSIVTAAVEGLTPGAVDADVATISIAVSTGAASIAEPGRRLESVDPTRRLFRLVPTGASLAVDAAAIDAAIDEGILATAAWLVGAGERLLAESVDYAKLRTQFGRQIGQYQAIKHDLASVRVALTFARPLVQRAALTLAGPDRARDVSAAKLAAGQAAHLSARVALQVHGAIGYTDEHSLGLWLTKVRALLGSWGTPAFHRDRVASAILRV